MVALSALGSGYVAAQNIEVTCMRLAQLQNTLIKYIFYTIIKVFLSADIPPSPLSDEV